MVKSYSATSLLLLWVVSLLCGQVSAQPQAGMKIGLASVFVTDQAEALRFYTEVLGFTKKEDEPVGKYRWLTVVSPADSEGTQLLLEPIDDEETRTFQETVYNRGTPYVMFFVDDIEAEYERLEELDVNFSLKPTKLGNGAQIAIFDDTCGNNIQLYQGP